MVGYPQHIFMSKKLIVYFDENDDLEMALELIQKLIAEGYTSGIDPHFEIVEDE